MISENAFMISVSNFIANVILFIENEKAFIVTEMLVSLSLIWAASTISKPKMLSKNSEGPDSQLWMNTFKISNTTGS